MKDDLLAKRQDAETKFNELQSSLNMIKAELKKYDLETVEEGYSELHRLQGEHRLIEELIAKASEPTEVPEPAATIDATKGDKNGKS